MSQHFFAKGKATEGCMYERPVDLGETEQKVALGCPVGRCCCTVSGSVYRVNVETRELLAVEVEVLAFAGEDLRDWCFMHSYACMGIGFNELVSFMVELSTSVELGEG